jgi:hypothetical protein
VAPLVLAAVVGLAVAGRGSATGTATDPGTPANDGQSTPAVGSPDALGLAPALVPTTIRSSASNPAATPSPSWRSDWPAAISASHGGSTVRVDPLGPRGPLTVPAGRRRVEGTDGLMGRLAFGLAGDTPLEPLVIANRFTIDDVALVVPRFDSTPPWVRRPGG